MLDALKKCVGVFMPFAAQDLDGIVTVNLGSKGVIELELVSSGEKWGRGPAKDIHSSLKAMVDSPAWHLVKALNTLVSDDGNVIMIDNYPKPLPPTAEEKTMIEKVSKTRSEALAKKQFTVQHWINDLPWDQANERLESQPTVNIEGLVGGYTGPGGKTVLPHRAVAKIDMRLVPDMKAADALAALKAHLAKRGFGDIEVNMTGGYDPTATSKDSALIQAQLATYKKFGIDALLWPRNAGSYPGYVFTGDPLKLAAGHFGLGHGSGAHAPDEYYVIESTSPKIQDFDGAVMSFVEYLTKWRSKALGGQPRRSRMFAGDRLLSDRVEFSLRPNFTNSHEGTLQGDFSQSVIVRLVKIRVIGVGRRYSNFASRLICVPARATETGQVFLVSSACSRNFATSMPGTSASVFKSIDVILNPPSTFQFHCCRRADAFRGMSCLFEVYASAIEKHPASPAPMSSSGFVPLPLKSGQKRERPFECAAAKFHRSPALFECAFPYRRSSSCCHCFVSFVVVRLRFSSRAS